jgi:hypothetical protein
MAGRPDAGVWDDPVETILMTTMPPAAGTDIGTPGRPLDAAATLRDRQGEINRRPIAVRRRKGVHRPALGRLPRAVGPACDLPDRRARLVTAWPGARRSVRARMPVRPARSAWTAVIPPLETLPPPRTPAPPHCP